MSEAAAQIALLAMGGYAVAGMLFAVVFIARGAKKIDPSVSGSSFGFAVMVFPGLVALWPVMLVKWARARGHAA